MTRHAMTGQLSEADILAYIRLSRTEKLGPVTFRRLMNLYGEPHAALSALPELAARGGRSKAFKPVSEQAAKREYEATLKLGGTFLVLGTAAYPKLLAQTPDAQPVMSCYGHAHLLAKPALAMVGARNASAAGQRIAGKLAKDIGARGLILVSGLARGIDRAAHQGALEAGTIAVIANGIDHSYPRENTELQQQICEQGLILCENPPGTAPQASQFPRRNRIISGLSLGVIVVEAARRSGSLITARLAGEYGRARFTARPALPWQQSSHPNRRGTDRDGGRHYGRRAPAHRKHGVENTRPENAEAPAKPACTGQRRHTAQNYRAFGAGADTH